MKIEALNTYHLEPWERKQYTNEKKKLLSFYIIPKYM